MPTERKKHPRRPITERVKINPIFPQHGPADAQYQEGIAETGEREAPAGQPDITVTADSVLVPDSPNLKAAAISCLGADAVPNLLAGGDLPCVYLPANVQTIPLSPPGVLVRCASLPHLRFELAKLADRWDLPFDDEGLKDLLNALRDTDDGRIAAAPEVWEFVRLALATNAAARSACPLWIGVPPASRNTSIDVDYKSTFNNQSDIIEIRIISTSEVIEPQGQGRSVPEVDEDKASQHLDAAIATVPKDAPYEDVAGLLEKLKHDANHRIIDRVVSAIKEKLQPWEHGSYSQKLEITRWLNAELRRFDIALASPEVDGPAMLAADPAGRGGEGRFQLKGKTKGTDGKYAYFNTQSLAELLDKVEFVDASRREALSEWRQRVSEQQPGEAARV